MIRVTYQIKDNTITNIVISGHAKYDDYGKDIVCASVSSIAISTINGILLIDKDSITYEENNDLKINNLKKDEITNKLLLNMINMFIELNSSYPKNIIIREEEIK